ncbi:uncharacterized protein LOC131681458 isoform X2 [Topomyia yanbarensis]|uniref:uncharacterized protein LOC131681458 isoform X2 n=1 Tax=Topomyia yanbarensis TaxID=2498891 RepID=UPI00273CBFE5|nr:uncharacterized protein LOC131681458 isoform X2 [Topomyia yanbarensis]
MLDREMGFSIIRIRDSDKDMDSCPVLRTSVYQIEVHSTNEIFEITAEHNSTNSGNCRNKLKFLRLLNEQKITRIRYLKDNVSGEFEELADEEFQEFCVTFDRGNFRVLDSKLSYSFDEDEDPSDDHYTELIEFHIQIVATGKEYLVNMAGISRGIEATSIEPRTHPLPSKMLLSLLGGGNYSKIQKIVR